MLRKEVLTKVSEKLEQNESLAKLTKDELGEVFNSVFQVVGEAVLAGESVTTPLGVFKLTTSAARKGRNPKTGEEIDIPARKRVAFSASKNFNVPA